MMFVQISYETGYELVVKVIYGDMLGLDVRMLFGRTENAVSDSEIKKLVSAIRLVKKYNEFIGDDVADLVLDLHNRGIISSVSFGRESSPVLYIKVPLWTSQSSKNVYGEKRQFSKRGFKILIDEVIYELHKVNPDSIDFVFDDEIRAWWG